MSMSSCQRRDVGVKFLHFITIAFCVLYMSKGNVISVKDTGLIYSPVQVHVSDLLLDSECTALK